jgi:hypothetical protein
MFIGADLHQRFCYMTCLDESGQVVEADWMTASAPLTE